MESFDRKRLGTWGFIILVVLNIGLLAIFWYDHATRQNYSFPQGEKPDTDQFLIRELRLSDDQARTFRDLRAQQSRQSDSVRGQIVRLGHDMIDELFKSSPDTSRIRQLSDAMGTEHARLEWTLFSHFQQVKQLCNPQQQENLKRIVVETFDRSCLLAPPSDFDKRDMGPGPPGDHPGGGPPPPPRR